MPTYSDIRKPLGYMANSSTTCLQVSFANSFCLIGYLTMHFSGICGILLRTVPLRLAHRSIPRTESSRHKLLALGSNSSHLDPMSNIQQRPRRPLHNGRLRGCCDSRSYIDDWILVHQTRDSTSPMHLVLCPWMGWYNRLLYLHGYFQTSRGFNP